MVRKACSWLPGNSRGCFETESTKAKTVPSTHEKIDFPSQKISLAAVIEKSPSSIGFKNDAFVKESDSYSVSDVKF